MTRLFRATALTTAMTLTSCQPMMAQPANRCAPRAQVLDRLTDSFGETRQSIGLGAENVLIEVFASRDTGSWTNTATLPDGTTCLIASGQAYERLSEALPTAGEKV